VYFRLETFEAVDALLSLQRHTSTDSARYAVV
jgi:hypothetical protein